MNLIDTKAISNDINRLMREHNIKQFDLIEKTGISYTVIRKIRDGNEHSSVENFNLVTSGVEILSGCIQDLLIDLNNISKEVQTMIKTNNITQRMISDNTGLSLPTIHKILLYNYSVSVHNYNKVIKFVNTYENGN